MDLSIIIPAYNEEKRLGSTLEKIKSYMDKKDFEYEVLVVDDGSRDRTVEIAGESALARASRLKIHRNMKNLGKGYSVKAGVAAAEGEYILLSDADLSTPICEFDKLIDSATSGMDIAVGSRSIASSNVILRQPLYRQTMGKAFNLLVRYMLREKIRDTQCGFKLFKKDVAKALFGELMVMGFAFDTEILFLARKHGYLIGEVGVKWENCPHSKVHPVISSLEMLKDIIKIRLVHR